MAVTESLVDYRRGDSSKPKPQSKGNHVKGGETRHQRGTPLRKDQVRPMVARMVRAKTNERSSRLGPITSYVMGHTGHGTTPTGKP